MLSVCLAVNVALVRFEVQPKQPGFMSELFKSHERDHNEASSSTEPELVDWFADGSASSRLQNEEQGSNENSQSSCKPSPEFHAIIEKVAQNIYDPSKLGDKETLKNKFNCQINSADDANKFAREVLQSIDKNSTVHSRAELAKIRERMGAGFGGIGANISREKDADGKALEFGPVTIRRMAKNGPADKAGLKVGDRVSHIEGEDISKLSLPQIIEKVRGPKDSSIALSIEGREKPVELKRDQINYPVVEDKALPENLAYVRLDNFEKDSAASELEQAVKRHPEAKGFILDLRGNMGGKDLNAYLVSSLFLKEGVVHRTRGRIESPSDSPRYDDTTISITQNNIIIESNSRGSQYLPRLNYIDKPIIVLMNGSSASASEIVIGALQDNNAATTIGTRSFGKGDGQRLLFNFPEGGMTRITALKGTTPNGHWFGNGADEKHGRDADIVVENAQNAEYGSEDDQQLKAGIRYLTEKTKKSEKQNTQ